MMSEEQVYRKDDNAANDSLIWRKIASESLPPSQGSSIEKRADPSNIAFLYVGPKIALDERRGTSYEDYQSEAYIKEEQKCE